MSEEMTSDRDAFWRALWQANETPWDLGGPHPEIAARHEALSDLGRVLVPGCGSGADAVALAALGNRVTAVDFAVPEERGAAAMARAGVRFEARDVLAAERGGAFDAWFEHTFFCAIPPSRRADWGRVAALEVRPGGALIAIAFPIGKPAEKGGPPFGVTAVDYAAALAPHFVAEIDEPVRRRVPTRSFEERFLVFRRR